MKIVSLDPATDIVDDNILNMAYNDQQIDNFHDELNNIKNRECCDGIFTGHENDDQIR